MVGPFKSPQQPEPFDVVVFLNLVLFLTRFGKFGLQVLKALHEAQGVAKEEMKVKVIFSFVSFQAKIAPNITNRIHGT